MNQEFVGSDFIERATPRITELLNQYPETFKQIKWNFGEDYTVTTDYFEHYKFLMAFYNKMFDENHLRVQTSIDYEMLVKISYVLKMEHLINWTRNKLYECIDNEKLYVFFMEMIIGKKFTDEDFETSPFKNIDLPIETMKIIFYFLRTIDILKATGWDKPLHFENKFYIDDWMIKQIPELKDFIKES